MFKFNKNQQRGQSLMETIVAIFVLTTAIAAGLGVGIFAFSAATTSQNEVVGANLAREGIEVVRMMRDSNWLAGDVAGGSYALRTCADLPVDKQQCYPLGFSGPTYNIGTPGSYRLAYNNSNSTWAINAGGGNYNLYQQSDGSFTHGVNGVSLYARKIVISTNTASPYTAQNPELIIQSIVGWTGKKCTPMTNQDPSTTNCRMTVEERLTNWKDYR
jgi:hypothetical protein